MKTKLIFLVFIFSNISISLSQNWNLVHPATKPITFVNEDLYYFPSESITSGMHSYTYKIFKVENCTTTIPYQAYGGQGCIYFSNMFFVSPDTGFLVDGCAYQEHLQQTTNGGVSWQSITGATSLAGSKTFFPSKNYGYFVFRATTPSGNTGRLMRINTNSATSTIVLDSSAYILGELSSYNMLANLFFINDSTGFISCKDALNNGILLKTTDYGTTWSEVLSHTNIIFSDITFVTDSIGFVIGNAGLVLKTTDGGSNWAIVQINTTANLNSISINNNGVGYIGSSTGLFKTTDMGDSWVTENIPTNSAVTKVKVFDSGSCYIVSQSNLYANFICTTPIEKISPSSNILISPNPIENNLLAINLPNEIHTFELSIFNLSGQLILSKSNIKEIDLGKIPSGIYIVKIVSDKGNYTEKFVVH